MPLAVKQQNRAEKKHVSIKPVKVHITDEKQHYWAIDQGSTFRIAYYSYLIHYCLQYAQYALLLQAQNTSVQCTWKCLNLWLKTKLVWRKEGELGCKWSFSSRQRTEDWLKISLSASDSSLTGHSASEREHNVCARLSCDLLSAQSNPNTPLRTTKNPRLKTTNKQTSWTKLR